MPRITPVRWKILECIFQEEGFVFERQTGSHRSYVKTGVYRPVVIPTYKEVDVEIIQSNMRTARMSREKYFELLKLCKKAS
jgi:predicted RNA binding protein YcfA (HicA-like mRNA interferase family)